MRISTPLAALLCLAAVPAAAGADGAPAGQAVTTFGEELRRQADGPVGQFYARRGYSPLWVGTDGLTPAAERFLALLRTSEVDGFLGSEFSSEAIADLVAEPGDRSPRQLAARELMFSRRFAHFVRAVSQPALPLRTLQEDVAPRFGNDDDILGRLAAAHDPADYVDRMQWMSPRYTDLRRALLRYRERWDGLPRIEVPAGRALRAGAVDARVELLRQRLGLPAATLFDAEVERKLRAFQADHGLAPTGILDAGTLAALNAPEGKYRRILEVNLERARALPGPDRRHVLVDAAAAQLAYYDHGRLVGAMRVVVGAPDSPTPLVAGLLHYATVNPYWNVPVDLVRKNIAPAAARGAPLKGSYEVLANWDHDAPVIDSSTIPWGEVASGRQEIRVRQRPGPGNAMGRVKFMFANELGIYLHDTPQRELFQRSQRHLSNGCIRLENADLLLTWLSDGQLTISGERPEHHLRLPRPVPVFVTYLTAIPNEQGIAFLADPYERDRADVARLAGR